MTGGGGADRFVINTKPVAGNAWRLRQLGDDYRV